MGDRQGRARNTTRQRRKSTGTGDPWTGAAQQPRSICSPKAGVWREAPTHEVVHPLVSQMLLQDESGDRTVSSSSWAPSVATLGGILCWGPRSPIAASRSSPCVGSEGNAIADEQAPFMLRGSGRNLGIPPLTTLRLNRVPTSRENGCQSLEESCGGRSAMEAARWPA